MIAKIRYDSPLVLTFALACTIAMALSTITGGRSTMAFFVLGGEFTDFLSWWRLCTYICGHADWGHLMSNMSLLLLLGPALERHHGAGRLFGMMAFTAIASGMVNMLLFDTGLLGASGIVFMFIVLSSFSNATAGTIPLSFMLVVALFLSTEVISAFRADGISQLAHLLGGACGAALGFTHAGTSPASPAKLPF
jgi:membrane associated rhomboid family serine protease